MSGSAAGDTGGAHFADWLLAWAHRVPHFNFRFHQLLPETSFSPQPDGEYAQSLVVFCALCLLLALLFLLATVVLWVSQCCLARRSSNSSGPRAVSQRRIGRLSGALFICSVLCFCLMGGCLFGNEYLNKSLQSSLDGLGHLNDGLRQAVAQTQKLNHSQWQLSKRVDELTLFIEHKSREHKDLNQTLIRQADNLLTELSDKVDELMQRLARTSAVLADTHFLDTVARNGHRFELERWLLCLLLLLIMCSVLFVGVVAFCRQSRKGAVIFSGLGLVIFLVAWLLFSAAFPLTVAHADFCSDGRPFLRTRLNDDLLDLVHFYSGDCAPASPEDGHPPAVPALPLALVSQLAREQAVAEQKLEALLARLFNASEEMDSLSRQTQAELMHSSGHLGALQALLQCGQLHKDVRAMRLGFCRHAFLGSALVSACLFLLGLALFVLLVLVSKSWYMFSRMPTDYLEVGEDDQFSPRCHDAMPDNIYDTNIFNPRARQPLAAEDTGGGGAVGSTAILHLHQNGGGQASATILPLLASANSIELQQAADLGGGGNWQQQMLAHNAAHHSHHRNSHQQTMPSAPPLAGATLRNGTGGGGTLGRNGGLRSVASANYHQLNGAGGGGGSGTYGRFQEFGNA